jgi:hypothetical protein
MILEENSLKNFLVPPCLGEALRRVTLVNSLNFLGSTVLNMDIRIDSVQPGTNKNDELF